MSPVGLSFLGLIDVSKSRHMGMGANVRFTRTNHTTPVIAALALSRFALEKRAAFMAGVSDALPGVLAGHFGLCHSRCAPLCSIISANGSSSSAFAFGDFGLRARVARTFLATSVLAIAADAFRTECCLATVARAVNSHANLLFDPWYTCSLRFGPLTGLQSQSVPGKQHASFLLLCSAGLLRVHSRARLVVFDGLCDPGWDGGTGSLFTSRGCLSCGTMLC